MTLYSDDNSFATFKMGLHGLGGIPAGTSKLIDDEITPNDLIDDESNILVAED